MKNSTTLLPEWFSILCNLDTTKKMMPCNVSTWWNSTFDMLNFAVKHITAINTLTVDHNMKLRQYELSKSYWAIAHQLRDVLKVCNPPFLISTN